MPTLNKILDFVPACKFHTNIGAWWVGDCAWWWRWCRDGERRKWLWLWLWRWRWWNHCNSVAEYNSHFKSQYTLIAYRLIFGHISNWSPPISWSWILKVHVLTEHRFYRTSEAQTIIFTKIPKSSKEIRKFSFLILYLRKPNKLKIIILLERKN